MVECFDVLVHVFESSIRILDRTDLASCRSVSRLWCSAVDASDRYRNERTVYETIRSLSPGGYRHTEALSWDGHAFVECCRAGKLRAARSILAKRGGEKWTRTVNASPALNEFLAKGDDEAVDLLLSAFANVQLSPSDSLKYSVREGKASSVRWFAETRGFEGMTRSDAARLLIAALHGGSVAVLDALPPPCRTVDAAMQGDFFGLRQAQLRRKYEAVDWVARTAFGTTTDDMWALILGHFAHRASADSGFRATASVKREFRCVPGIDAVIPAYRPGAPASRA